MDVNVNIFSIIRNGDFESYLKNIDQIDINITQVDGCSMLHRALSNYKFDIALDLIHRLININLQDKKGMTSLHYISFYPNIEVANALISNGGNIEMNDLYGNTPLWYAVVNARRKYEIVDLFMQNLANPNSVNKVGKTPLDFAQKINDFKLIRLLTK